jgi:hypothetical protein
MSFEGSYGVSGDSFSLAGTISTSISTLVGGGPQFGNNIVLTGDSTLNLIGQMNYYATISGSHSLTLIGGGPFWQEGNNTYTGATIITNGSLFDASNTGISSSSALTINSTGTLQLETGIVQHVASLTGSGTISGSGTLIDPTTGFDTFSGQITGSTNLTVSGTGLLILSATGNGTGPVTLSPPGQLVYDGNLPSATLDQTGGELYGTGTVGTLDATGGTIELGDFSPGALHAGVLDLASGSNFDWAAVSSSYDSFVATTSVTLGGSFGIGIIGSGYTPATGTVFTIITNHTGSPVSGTFQGLPGGTIFQYQNADWQISYNGGNEHDVTLTYLGFPTTIALATTASPAAYGQTVLNATVSSVANAGTITGTVTFDNGSTVIGTANVGANGIATLDATSLPVGTYSITAQYSGDTVYLWTPASSPVSQTVSQAPTTLSVVPSASSATIGSSISLTAIVLETDSPSEPTGNVVFSDNGTTIGSAAIDGTGHAALTGVVPSVGSNAITASYAGDGNFLGSATSGSASVAVTPDVSISSPTLTKGTSGTTNATFTATLSAASNVAVTLDYATHDGSATAGRDYITTTGMMTFYPGQTSKTITVPVMGGMDWQPDRSFSVVVSSVVNAIGPNLAPTATIQSTDGMPTAGLMPDELDPSQTDLVINVGAGNAVIALKSTKVAGQVQVVVNRHVVATDSNLDRVIVYGGTGNNTLTVAPKITAGVIFFGGAGRNMLTGGRGNDILVGGNGGRSTLNDSAGANLLIGGAGLAHLTGSAFGNILVGGSTPYDAGTLSDIQTLEGLLQTWTDGTSYANRVSELAAGTSADGGTISTATVTLVTGDKATGRANRDVVFVAAPVKPGKK